LCCLFANKKVFSVIVAASTSCIPGEPLTDVFERLVDLEYTNIELVIGEQGVIVPSQIAARHDAIVQLRRSSRRIVPVAIFFDVEPESPESAESPEYQEYIKHFTLACRLAKDCGIVVMTVHAAAPGTPFNNVIDHLRKLVEIGMHHGVVVGIATEAGRITEAPETVESLCKHVKGLGVTLDPSHYIYNFSKPKDYESILPHVCHVRLRDTTQKLFQTRLGQGAVDFSRLRDLLSNVEYRRALCVDLAPLPGVDQSAELRKMRLLLESSL
jgi:sugar phosphate isomerase/epimerase